ncbi:sensor domain-containing diguanylate cyclase [Niallia taxi]|uniref:sensor domain-containing diguanylate cyclase n=1 Tax=Niallia taxi TaxID=2499688 RepID=UPI003D2E3793
MKHLVKSSTKKIIWAIWIMLIPVGLWLTYHLFPPDIAGEYDDLLAFLIFMAIVASMPMIINGVPVFFLQWATISVFLIFGLFVEMVLVQIALLTLMLQMRLDKKSLFRLPMNSAMFLLVSFLSGVLYYSLGGSHGTDLLFHIDTFLLILFYPLIYFILNAFILYCIDRLVYKRKTSFFTKDSMWEFFTTLITYPVGFALYIMYLDIGLMALILIGIPFICLSVVLRQYHSSQTINSYLKKIAEIGHQLSQTLFVKETINLFIDNIFELIKVDVVYVDQVNSKNELESIARVEKQKRLPIFSDVFKENEGIIGRVLAAKKPAVFHKREDWEELNKGFMPDYIESVLCMPIIKNKSVIGILLLGSAQKKAFARMKLMILDLLCTQFAVALDNARYFEKTKENSERCALTKLYNYRYFEQHLTTKFAEMNQNLIKGLTVIMLDIDHFKSINDTYGHQAGNEILVEFADRVARLIGKHGVVARYGGEEFVILLEDTTMEEAQEIAEFLRKMIETRSFAIKQNMNENESELQVNLTASLGLASAPEQADEAMALIRHADRALYVGAKRAGRNRVACYMK